MSDKFDQQAGRMLSGWPQRNALLVLDAVAGAIVALDSEGVIEYVNSATSRLFGYNRFELLGAPLALLIPESDRAGHETHIDRFRDPANASTTGEPRELSAFHKDGHEFPVHLVATELQAENSTHFVVVIHDLSAQKTSQASMLLHREQLARVGRVSTMGEMTASIAHEMNQPLTAVAMYAQTCQRLLDQGDFDVGSLQDALEKLADQVLRAGAVNERVQQFVKADDNSLERKSINQLLLDIEPLAAGDARLHGVAIVLELEAELPEVRCSALQVQQVALNLIRNALDAIIESDDESDQTVFVQTRLVDGAVRVSVIDSGPGISADQCANLFRPFYTTKAQGMGLGLSTCRKLITDHGGTIDFFNHQPNGATFYFSLPSAESHRGKDEMTYGGPP